MKTKKTNVFRLELEKDNCTCRIAREYSDPRYTTPISEPVFTACEKHAANEMIAEFAQEMMVEALANEAANAGKTYVPPNFRQVDEEGGGGIVATGESQEVITGINLPKRPQQQNNGPRRDPLSITQVQVDRPQRSTMKTAASGGDFGNLAVAQSEVVKDVETGVEISTDIGVEVPEDPNLSAYLDDTMGGLGDMLDQDDAKIQGTTKYLSQGE